MSEPPSEGEPAEPGRCIGLDLGTVRIGVAVTDAARTLAVPHGVISRCGDERADHEGLAQLVDAVGATLVVVGVPFSLDGTIGPAAARVIAETARLRLVLAVPVVTVDERFSTVEATRRRREAGGRGGAGPRTRFRRRPGGAPARAPVDAAAAALILQSYLDQERAM
ncbi:MAG: Holliday junction resolvase RuvX [Acidimicrobiales bacterium]